MSLGRFGGRAPRPKGTSGFTGSPDMGDGGLEQARDKLNSSLEGNPAAPAQLALLAATLNNLLRNGGFENYDTATLPALNWTRTGTGVSSNRSTTNVKEGTYAGQLTNGAGNTAEYSQAITVSATVNEDFRGNVVSLSCWVWAAVADRVSLQIDDGVGTTQSAFHQGGSRFELLTVTRTLDAAATTLTVRLQISAGAAISPLFDACMLVRGNTPVAFSPHPRDSEISAIFTNSQVFTASGTWTRPTGVTTVFVRVWGGGGGGGGGGGANGGNAGGGGGGGGAGGGYTEAVLAVTADVTVTIGAGSTGGAGGAAGAAGSAPGSAAGSSSFGSVTATAGNGGSGGAGSTAVAVAAGGAGGAAVSGSGGDVSFSSGQGEDGTSSSGVANGPGGKGCKGGQSGAAAGGGGSGGNAGIFDANGAAGQNGSLYGGGGGGGGGGTPSAGTGRTGGAGGDGRNGLVIVHWTAP